VKGNCTSAILQHFVLEWSLSSTVPHMFVYEVQLEKIINYYFLLIPTSTDYEYVTFVNKSQVSHHRHVYNWPVNNISNTIWNIWTNRRTENGI
jgi:hypothetical protein